MRDAAELAIAPGHLLPLVCGDLQVDVAPEAGGRLAQVTCGGRPWLVPAQDVADVGIAWGSYPMLPWAGRIREGRFAFDGKLYQLPPNLGPHAIHGVGFQRPWRVDVIAIDRCRLSLALPSDADWPFGGEVTQDIALTPRRMLLRLSLTASERAMPCPVLGWHPWLLKPERLAFTPSAMYPRDAAGIAVLPPGSPSPGPWDDCFIQRGAVRVSRGGMTLGLRSDCDHWVVYDQPAHATCIEPQTGPPDAFNLRTLRLEPGETVRAWSEWRFDDQRHDNT